MNPREAYAKDIKRRMAALKEDVGKSLMEIYQRDHPEEYAAFLEQYPPDENGVIHMPGLLDRLRKEASQE